MKWTPKMTSLNFFYLFLFLVGVLLISSFDEDDDDDQGGGILQPTYNGATEK